MNNSTAKPAPNGESNDLNDLNIKKRKTMRKIFNELQSSKLSGATQKGLQIFLKYCKEKKIEFLRKEFSEQIEILQNFFKEKGVDFNVELPTEGGDNNFIVIDLQKKNTHEGKEVTVETEGKEIVGVIGNPGQDLGALREVLPTAFAQVQIMDLPKI